MEKKETFRFGVMGAGNISNKFCDAAEKTEEVCVTAVAARSEERAREFAEKYEIHTYYGNYEEMLQKEKLDGVYIGVVTGMHVQLTELCIRYGIPVLCEKALTGSSEEAERIFKLAEEKKIFVMEGVWSLFLPANRIPAVLPCHIEQMGGVCKKQSYTKRPRLPVMETGGAAVLWETPQALQSLSAAES